MTRQPKSALRILIDERLKARRRAPLQTLVKSYRARGASWAEISHTVYDLTNVRITGESLRNWFGETEPADTASA